jgi:hypothetical protein
MLRGIIDLHKAEDAQRARARQLMKQATFGRTAPKTTPTRPTTPTRGYGYY